MLEAVEAPPMPKKKLGRPNSARDDATAKIDRSVLGRAQLVAKDMKIPVAELLTDLVRDPLDVLYRDLVKRLDQTPAPSRAEDSP